MAIAEFQRPSVSNGNPDEQALIRRWWWEQESARGQLVWEYHVDGYYVDALWFPEAHPCGTEHPGRGVAVLHPVHGADVVLCEAKLTLNPELIGQAVVYSRLLRNKGANVSRVLLFCRTASADMRDVARHLQFEVVASDA